jgi:hypothetical protein
MGLNPVQVPFALGPHDGLLVDLEPPADGFKRVRRRGASTVRHEGRRGPILEARRVEAHQRRPRRFRRGHGARQDGTGISLQDQDAPPLDAVEGKVHLAAINEPVFMAMLRLVGMRLRKWLWSWFGDMRDIIWCQDTFSKVASNLSFT